MTQQAPSWKKSVALVAVSQFLVTATVSLTFPLMPQLVRSLGVDPSREALYAGLVTASGGVPMVFTAPLWGALADRFGRKPMLIRATFATGVAFGVFAIAPNVGILTLARVLQGTFAGMNTAAFAFIASVSPREYLPRVMGISQGAVFLGITLGPAAGGIMVDAVGFQTAFIAAAIAVAAWSLVLWFFVSEQFEKPEASHFSLKNVYTETWAIVQSRAVLAILAIVMFANAAPLLFVPTIPALLESLGGREVSVTTVGVAFSIMGVVAGASAPLFGRFGDRLGLRNILVMSCVGAAVVYTPILLITNLTQFYILWTLVGLTKGGLMVASTALIGLAVSRTHHGRAFGAFQVTTAVAIVIGPLGGGIIGSAMGPKAAFGVAGLIFAALAVSANLVIPKHFGRPSSSGREDPEEASARSTDRRP